MAAFAPLPLSLALGDEPPVSVGRFEVTVEPLARNDEGVLSAPLTGRYVFDPAFVQWVNAQGAQ